jgi:hypothetical protein
MTANLALSQEKKDCLFFRAGGTRGRFAYGCGDGKLTLAAKLTQDPAKNPPNPAEK